MIGRNESKNSLKRMASRESGPGEGAGFLPGPVFVNRAQPDGAPVQRRCHHIPAFDAGQF